MGSGGATPSLEKCQPIAGSLRTEGLTIEGALTEKNITIQRQLVLYSFHPGHSMWRGGSQKHGGLQERQNGEELQGRCEKRGRSSGGGTRRFRSL